MFRALACPSSGGQIVLSQHLVSSLSVQYSTVKYSISDDSRLHTALQSALIRNTVLYCTVLYRE